MNDSFYSLRLKKKINKFLDSKHLKKKLRFKYSEEFVNGCNTTLLIELLEKIIKSLNRVIKKGEKVLKS